MESNWFYKALGALDMAIELLLSAMLLILAVMFLMSLADSRSLENIAANWLFWHR